MSNRWSQGDGSPGSAGSPSTPRRRMSWAGMKQRMMEGVVGGSAADVDHWNLEALPDDFYDLGALTAKGDAFPFHALRGQTVLVVNVASY